MTEAAVEVKGLRKFNKLLAEAGEEIQEDMKSTNLEIADLIADAAKPRTPIKSGKLRGSIRTSATFRTGSVKVGNKKKVPYAKPIHFGWKKRNIKPTLFLYEALDKNRDEARDMYLAKINEIVAKLGAVDGED